MAMRMEHSMRARRDRTITRRDLIVASLAATVARPAAALVEPLAGTAPAMRPAGAAPREWALPIRVNTLNNESFGCADLRSTVACY